MKISLCMIVRNESATLNRCLDSVANVVDEIIIVDTGSTDNTKQIAFEYTDKIYDFTWIDDFSAARNFAFSKATNEWLMWLDADDILPLQSREKLSKLKHEVQNDIDVIYMPYAIAFDERGNSTFTYYRERIVRTSANPKWIEPVHEVIDANGRPLYTDITVEHRKVKVNPSGRNLKIMEKQLKERKSLSPRLTFYYARELMFNRKYDKAIRIFKKFINDSNGWIENKICACYDLSVCFEVKNEQDNSLEAALKGLSYGKPRCKILCRIGELFLKKGDLLSAKYWYEAALDNQDEVNMGFNESDYSGFIPAIQLCVIFDRLGNPDKAVYYNEIAGGFKPQSPAYLYNREYFKQSEEKNNGILL